MLPSAVSGYLLALAAALSWGSGDFLGGYASRKISQYQVLYLLSLSGLPPLILLVILAGEPLPDPRSGLFALAAGASGAVGIAALFRGLVVGSAAVVSPLAGVVGVLVPLGVGLVLEGFPGWLKAAGFGLAVLGIGTVTRAGEKNEDGSPAGFGYGFLAGLGFGGFLTLIAQVGEQAVYAPLLISKLGALVAALLLLRRVRQPLPGLRSSPLALFVGVIDVAGNLFYLLATHQTRLDSVAVLASLYPAVTVLLSIVLLRQRVTLVGWLGVLACLGAIVLITG